MCHALMGDSGSCGSVLSPALPLGEKRPEAALYKRHIRPSTPGTSSALEVKAV